MRKLLEINASARKEASTSRKLVALFTDHFRSQNGDSELVERDLADGVPLITEEMIDAFYTPKDKRTNEQLEVIKVSDALVQELRESDVLVFGVPMYNFGIPASLKAYFDLVARVGETFKYTEKGPEGLLKNKKAYVIIATGGTKVGTDIDFVSGYIKLFLGFVGIRDVEFIAADLLMSNGDEKVKKVEEQILST